MRPAKPPVGTEAPSVPHQRGGVPPRPVRRRNPRRPAFCLAGLEGCDVEPVGQLEARWMSVQRELILDLCDGAADGQTLADVLTRVHQAWDRQPQRPAPTTLIALFGLAMGDLLIRRLPGLGWVLMSDGRTAELALTQPRGDLAVFPLSAVAQRWDSDTDGDWLLPYVEQVVAAVRAESTPSGALRST